MFVMLVQHYPSIGSSSRVCWQVTMCARVDTDTKIKIRTKENIILLYFKSKDTDHLSCFIIRNISEQKYFDDIKHVAVTADSPDLSDSVAELAYPMLNSFTPQMGIAIEEKNILAYISGYISRKVSQSACDQCKVILMPIINFIHFCLRNNICILRVWGYCSTMSKLNTINWFKLKNFRKYT